MSKNLTKQMAWLWMALAFMALNLSVWSEQPSKTALQAQLMKLPLYFEKNEGQIDSQVKYLTRGAGYFLYFTPQEIVMSLKGTQDSFAALNMQFLGSNSNPQVKGLEQQTYKSHYLIGNDSSKWRSNISNYSKVCYEGIYPGIDVIFYGNGQQLEYDICIAPGGDPSKVQLQIDGAEKLFIDEEGHLHIATNDQKEVQMQKPIIYQFIEDKQVAIEGQFQLLACNQIGFKVGAYDSNQSLIIDPVISYATYLGGSGLEQAGGNIAVDSAGNVYVIGVTTSTNFPLQGPYQATLTGAGAAFVTKLNPAGNSLVYSTYFGGLTGITYGAGIALDSANNAYIVGTADTPDLPVTPGVVQTTYAGGQDAFVAKLDATGSNLVYCTYLGGSNLDNATDVAVDSLGNVYIVGTTGSTDFHITAGAAQTTYGGGQFDVYITKLNSDATQFVYSTYLGGNQTEMSGGIAIDAAGNAYVTGTTRSGNFPLQGPYQAGLMGPSDAFVTKLNAAGSQFVYSTYLGGTGDDGGAGIAVDAAGCAYVTGGTASPDFPIMPLVGALQPTLNGQVDAFVTKLNAAGNQLVYSTYLGGSQDEVPFSIALDTAGNAYVSGRTNSPDFYTTSGAYQTTYGGGSNDVFMTQINPAGTAIVYSTFLGGSGADTLGKVAVDSNQNIFVYGQTNSPDFPTFNPLQPGLAGSTDAFIARFITTSTTALAVSPNPAGVGQTVTLTATISPSNVTGTVDFFDGVILIGTSPVVGGVAVLQVNSFSLGAHSLTAVYSGDTSFAPSTSAPVNLAVTQATSTTTLIVAPNPAEPGQPVNLTATLSSAAATGTVDFFDGMTLLASVPVVGGVAAFSTDSFSIGLHSLTAVYSGDANFSGSASASVILEVEPSTIATTTTLVATPNPAIAGQPVTFTATVSPPAATGTVSILAGGNLLGSAALVNGTATLTVNAPATVGIVSIVAVYSGDATFSGSTSGPVLLVVGPSAPVLPPRSLRGFQEENRFAMQTDLVNVLRWKAPLTGNRPVAYRIYRGNLHNLIAIVKANERLVYEDHNRRERKTYVYYVVSVDEFGNRSQPASVVIK